MSEFNRRNFLKIGGGVLLGGALAGCATMGGSGAKKKVVVVGGGSGGATAARYLRKFDAGIEVTLIEANTHYHTCFMSNEVLGGERSMDSIRFGYDGLKSLGVNVVHDWVTQIDP
ncbi:MAG: FAD/NAD(P)-binding oxidoreductase, partial [Pseudomonadota bacterium]